jgi:hypothetical protein
MMEEHFLSPLFLEARYRTQFSRNSDNLSLFLVRLWKQLEGTDQRVLQRREKKHFF